MNKIYSTVWNAELGQWVVASELARGGGGAVRSGRAAGPRHGALALTLAMLLQGWSPGGHAGTISNDGTCDSGAGASVGRTNPGDTNNQPTGTSGTYATIAGCESTGNNHTAATVYGAFSQILGEGGAAFGFNSRAGKWATAVGLESRATATGSTALGFGATANALNAVAIGSAGGDGTTPLSVANSTLASGEYAIAIGGHNTKGAQATETSAIAIGGGAAASGHRAIALGTDTVANADRAIAVGSDASATQANAIAIGESAQATGAQSIAQGYLADAGADYAVALGSGSDASALNSLAVGRRAQASGESATALGMDASAAGSEAVAIGYNASAAGANAFAGGTATAHGAQGIALGFNAVAGVAGSSTVANDIAIGNAAQAVGGDSIALGTNAKATMTGSIAIGKDATSNGPNSVSIGTGNTASGEGAVAIGDPNSATGVGAVALGNENTANGQGAIAQGNGNTATGQGAIAIGDQNTASGRASLALGTGSVASAAGGVAIGDLAQSQFAGAIAIGGTASAGTVDGIAIGRNATLSGLPLRVSQLRTDGLGFPTDNADGGANPILFSSVVLGDNASSVGAGVALGSHTEADGASSVALGMGAHAHGTSTLAIGVASYAEGGYSTALGRMSVAQGSQSLAIGQVATAVGTSSVAIGDSAYATGNRAVALGSSSSNSVNQDTTTNTRAVGADSLAFGTSAAAFTDTGIAFGLNAVAGVAGSATAISDVAIGTGAQATGGNSVAIGTGAQASGASAISIGNGNQVSGNNSGAIGDPTVITGSGSYSLGNDNTIDADEAGTFGNDNVLATGAGGSRIVGNGNDVDVADAFVIGNGADVTVAGGVALGSGSVSDTAAGVAGYVPTGASATDAAAIAATVATRAAVDVGSRQITGVAAGTADDDAVNVSQLTALANTVDENATHYYSVNDNGVQGGNYDNDGATGVDAIAAGVDASASVASGTALGHGAVAGAQTGDVALGSGSTTVAVVNTAGATVDNVGYTYAGTAATSTVSVGSAGAERTLTNVAAGRVDATSTDAINGSQLFATDQAVDALGDDVDTVGTTTAASLGGTSAYDPATHTVTAGLDVDGTTHTTVQDALTQLSETANAGWNVSDGSSTANIGPDGTVTFSGDGNLTVTQTGADDAGAVEITLNENIDLGPAGSVTTGAAVLSDAGLAVGTDVTLGSTGLSIVGGPSVTTTGIDAGGTVITNVAPGVADTDAVNVSQLTGLGETPMTFTGNAGTVDRLLGEELLVTGAATSPGTYSGVNLRTEVVGNELQIQMTDQPVFGTVSVNTAGAGTISGLTNQTFDPDNYTSGQAATEDQLKQVSDIASAGWNVSDGSSTANIGPDGTVTFSGDGNLTVTQTGVDDAGEVEITLNENIDLGPTGSVTTGAAVLSDAGLAVGSEVTLGNTGLSIVGGPSVTTTGIDAGGTVITNVAPGVAGTDAVNVDQLQAVGDIASAGWNVSDGSSTANIGPDGTVTFSGDGNLTVTQTGVDDAGTVEITLNENIDLGPTGSVTTGAAVLSDAGLAVGTDVTLGNTGLSIAGGPSVTTAGIDAGGMVITNVAPGVAGTDAVNVDQLTDAVASAETKYYHVNSTGGGNEDNDGATGDDAIAVGKDALAGGNEAMALGLGASADGDGSLALGAGAVASHSNSLALGAGSETLVGAQAQYQGAYVGASSSTGEVNIGGRQITGVAAGSADNDAVNVSQLQAGVDSAITESKEYTDTQIENVNTSIDELGDRVTVVEGDIADLGDRVTNIEGDVNNLSTTVNQFDERIADVEDTVTAMQEGTYGAFQVSEDSDTSGPSPTGTNSSAGGAGAVASGDNALAVGNQSTASANNSTALGTGAEASHENSVALGAGSATTVGAQSDYNAAFVGNSNSTGEVNIGGRTLTGVAPGVAGTDAVNVNQLNAGVNSAVSQANRYTDSRIAGLENDVWQIDRGYRGATASAMAMAGLPQAYLPGKSMLAVGLGGYQGEYGMAVGLSGITDNGSYVYRVQASGNTTRDWGFSVGAGVQW